jgi:dTDP-4-amino-4,6-dideoxygalactose transaminase
VAKLAVKGGAPVRERPFVKWPIWDDADGERLLQVMRSGAWGNDGTLQREFEQAFATYHGALDAVSVTNGTVTLLLCLRALGIKPGDEVIVPALTWIATATCVLEANAVPVFADVDPRTFCLDPRAVEAAISPRTVAIVPVHLYSCMADMDAFGDIARRRGLAVIEDCAHAHGGRWKDRAAGVIGDLGSYSFQSSKTMTAGEGGAVIGRRKDLLDRVYSQKDCGRHRPDRGERILGGNHRMTEWQAAILLGQLGRLDEHVARREESIRKLRRLAAPLRGIRIVDDQAAVSRRPCYRLGFHYNREEAGGIPVRSFIEAVRAEGVPIEAPYPVVYENDLYAPETMTWGARPPRPDRCPNAETIARDAAFMLPHPILLGDDRDLEDVVAAFSKVLAHPHEAADLASRAKDQIKGALRKFR